MKRLYRSGKNKILVGVCGGVGEYFNVDPVIVRILWIVWALAYGTGIVAYILAALIIPKRK